MNLKKYLLMSIITFLTVFIMTSSIHASFKNDSTLLKGERNNTHFLQLNNDNEDCACDLDLNQTKVEEGEVEKIKPIQIEQKKGQTAGENLGKLTDENIIKTFKKYITFEIPSYATSYSFDQFNWDNATHFYYSDTESYNIQVPANGYNMDGNAYFLIFNYNNKGEITSPFIITLDKKNDKSGDIIYSTLDKEPIVKLSMNDDKVEYKQIDHSLKVNKSEGYWSCVKNCLKKAWDESIPGPIKWLCSGACGSCLWGPNPFSCAACVGCLGGAAGACTAGCAI